MKKFVSPLYIVLLCFVAVITIWYFGHYQPGQKILNAEPRKVYRALPLKSSPFNVVEPHNRSVDIETVVDTPGDKQKEITDDLGPEYANTEERTVNTIDQENTTPSKASESPDAENFDAEAWESYLESELQVLYAEIDEKYPELVGFASLTEEEAHTLYPTLEARVVIGELAAQAYDDFMGRFVEIFSQMPQSRQVMALSFSREIVAKNWGEAFADEIINTLLTELDIPSP